MTQPSDVTAHYGHGNVLSVIRAGIAALGKSESTVAVDDLAPVDEFHIGGRRATEAVLAQLGLEAQHRVLDVGCGLGGTARFVASRFGCTVSGIDLTPEYVETGNTMCGWVGLAERVTLHQGTALSLPFEDASFDRAYMLHVGMNIADKAELAAQVARVLRPGGLFCVYDVMLTGAPDLKFPVPWATQASASAVAEPAAYRKALEMAGFAITAERNKRDFALAFFSELRASQQAAGGPGPLGLHLLMGRNTPEKVANMLENISSGRIAPVEMIAVRR